MNLWSKLIIDAKFKARTSHNLSEIYSKNLVSRLVELADDIQRISRLVSKILIARVREASFEFQLRIKKNLT